MAGTSVKSSKIIIPPRQIAVWSKLLNLEEEIDAEEAQLAILAGEGQRAVIAPKDEIEEDEGDHNPEDSRQGKIKRVLHDKEGKQAFKDLVETRGVPSRGQPDAPFDEARQAISQQGRERKHQPRCHIKTFDPRARDRDQDRKQVPSPGFGRSQQGASIQKTRPAIQGRGKTVP